MNGTSRPDRATLSEVAQSPCPDVGASDSVRYARLVKPFPVGKLDDVLYHVLATAGSIGAAATRLQIAPPRTLDGWRQELDKMLDDLWLLRQYAHDAELPMEELQYEGERSYETAIQAVQAMLRGLP
jgi:hypothetical protein